MIIIIIIIITIIITSGEGGGEVARVALNVYKTNIMQLTGVLSPVQFISTSALVVERPVLAGRILPSLCVGNFSPVTAMNKGRPFKLSWSVQVAKFLIQLPRSLSPLLMNTTMFFKGKSGGCRN